MSAIDDILGQKEKALADKSLNGAIGGAAAEGGSPGNPGYGNPLFNNGKTRVSTRVPQKPEQGSVAVGKDNSGQGGDETIWSKNAANKPPLWSGAAQVVGSGQGATANNGSAGVGNKEKGTTGTPSNAGVGKDTGEVKPPLVFSLDKPQSTTSIEAKSNNALDNKAITEQREQKTKSNSTLDNKAIAEQREKEAAEKAKERARADKAIRDNDGVGYVEPPENMVDTKRMLKPIGSPEEEFHAAVEREGKRIDSAKAIANEIKEDGLGAKIKKYLGANYDYTPEELAEIKKSRQDILKIIDDRIKATTPQSEEAKAKEEKRRRRAELWASVGDVVSSLSNLYYTNRYAPNMFNPDKLMSSKMRERYEKLKNERDAKEKEYLTYALKRQDLLDDFRGKDDKHRQNQMLLGKLAGEIETQDVERQGKKDKADAEVKLIGERAEKARKEGEKAGAQKREADANTKKRNAEADSVRQRTQSQLGVDQSVITKNKAQANLYNTRAAHVSSGSGGSGSSGGKGGGKEGNYHLTMYDVVHSYKSKSDYEKEVVANAKKLGIPITWRPDAGKGDSRRQGQQGKKGQEQLRTIAALAAEIEERTRGKQPPSSGKSTGKTQQKTQSKVQQKQQPKQQTKTPAKQQQKQQTKQQPKAKGGEKKKTGYQSINLR